jgi:hypothetical protein
MQPYPCSTHYAPCAHDLARHEAGTAILSDFPKLNFSEYVEQITAQVRASLLPELQKAKTRVQEMGAELKMAVQLVGITERKFDVTDRKLDVSDSKMHLFELAKNREQEIPMLRADVKSSVPAGPDA